jgi:hypothetical protein
LIGVVSYYPIRFSLPLVLGLEGYKRSKVGKCTFWAPPKRLHEILEGARFLQTLDPELFGRLTIERRYVVWYHPKISVSCRDVFSVTDNFILWGREGVALCLVQNVLDFTLLRLPFEKTLAWEKEDSVASRREMYQRIFRWLREHSFPEDLVNHYEELIKRS